MIFNMSGGGTSLNYKVVGGTSEPSNPVENTIWVNTDVPIAIHAFSATEPTSPVEGMVWFDVGASSVTPINVLKKDTLMVYLLDAKQYVADSWLNKHAEIYQNGWASLSPFPMSLIPVTDRSKWTIGNSASSFTDEGYIDVYKHGQETIDYNDAIELSTAGEIVITYHQSWGFLPILDVINATTGNKEFTITGTTSKIMTLDVSTAQGWYYLHITTTGWYGDRTLVLQSLDITRRAQE